jgi:hypothetical protein
MRNLKAKSALRNFEIIQGGGSQEQSAYEEKIEVRLRHLTDAVERFITTLPAALLAEQSSSHEIFEELVVKQSALQWIVSTAKHSQGAVRQKLWSDIDQSLSGLEKALERFLRLQCIERHSRVPAENRCSGAKSHRS